MGWGGLSEMSNVKMSKSPKDVKKVSTICHVPKDVTMDNITWHRGLQTMRSILRQNMKIIKNAEKTYFMNFLNVCSDHHMWCQNLPHCVWILLCQVEISMNLIRSQGVWLFDIFTHGRCPQPLSNAPTPVKSPTPYHISTLHHPYHRPKPLPHDPAPTTYQHPLPHAPTYLHVCVWPQCLWLNVCMWLKYMYVWWWVRDRWVSIKVICCQVPYPPPKYQK